MKIKLAILLAAVAALTLWGCRWDLEELIFVEVFLEPLKISEGGDFLELTGRIEGLVDKETVEEYGFVWSTNGSGFPGLGNTDTISNNLNALNGNYSSQVSVAELLLDETYFFWAYAITKDGEIKNSAPLDVQTGKIAVEMGTIDSVLLTFYVLEGKLQGLAGLALGRVSQHGHVWYNDTERDSSKLGKPLNIGSFRSIVTNLLPNTEYHVQAYAKIQDSLIYSDEIIIKTNTIQLEAGLMQKNDSLATARGNIKLLTFLNEITPDSLPKFEVEEYGFIWSHSTGQQDTLIAGTALENDITFDTTLFTFPPNQEETITVNAYAILSKKDNTYRSIIFSDTVVEQFRYERAFWGPVDVEDGPSARSGAVAFVLKENGNEFAYVGLGRDQAGNDLGGFFKFDGTAWTPVLANDGPSARSGAVAFVLNEDGQNVAYVGLGYGQDSVFFKFDPSVGSDGQWTTIQGFPGSPRGGAVAFTLGNKGYVGLGENADKSFYEYSPESGWNPEPASVTFPGEPRQGAVSFVMEGDQTAYVGLGDVTNGDFYSCYVSEGTLMWSSTPIPFITGGPLSGAVAFVVNGEPYVGLGENIQGFYDRLGVFSNGSFREITGYEPFPGGGRSSAVGFGLGTAGYIGTGRNESGNAENTFWKFELQ